MYISATCSPSSLWSSLRQQSVWLAGCAHCSGSAAYQEWTSSSMPSCGGGTYLAHWRQHQLDHLGSRHMENCNWELNAQNNRDKFHYVIWDELSTVTLIWEERRHRCEVHQCVVVFREALVQPYEAIGWALGHPVVARYHHVDATPEAGPI